MTMLSFALAPIFALQGAAETAIAVRNDAPETWSVEYPRIVSPQVEEYRRCLNAVDRRLTGKPDFEAQHRADIPRCETISQAAQEEANRVIGGRTEYSEFTPERIAETFDHIGRIHIARGADLDSQFRMRIEGAERAQDNYERARPKGLVIELRDASGVEAQVEQNNATEGGR